MTTILKSQPSMPIALPVRGDDLSSRRACGVAIGLAFTLFASFWLSILLPGQILGFNISGWLWVVVLLAAVIVLIGRASHVKFPVLLWTPWVAYLCLRIEDWTFSGVQSTVQILLPILVGCAASTSRNGHGLLNTIRRWLWVWFLCLVGCFAFYVLPWALSDIENSGWITGGIIALFFQSYYLCTYLITGRKFLDLLKVVVAGAIPVLLTLRGPVLGSLALCVGVVAPLSLPKRAFIVMVAVTVAVGAFYTPRFQTKMFYSGQGSLSDLRADNADVNRSGRAAMKELLESNLGDSTWLGHGADSAAKALLSSGLMREAHNDWLRIRYCYGRLGVIIFAITLATQCILLALEARGARQDLKVVMYSAASCCVPFAVVMFTDNIIVYCQYYTAPHFFLIGLCYAVLGNDSKRVFDRTSQNSLLVGVARLRPGSFASNIHGASVQVGAGRSINSKPRMLGSPPVQVVRR